MTRGLSSGAITNLQTNPYKTETLVELYLPNNTYYLTTGDSDISVNTSTTSGSQTFVPESFISGIESIDESFEPRPIQISLQFQRLTGGFAADFASNIVGSRVVINKMFRSLTDNSADTTNLIQIFDGITNSFDTSESPTERVYNIRCSSDFGFFTAQKGRTTANIDGALTRREIVWGAEAFE